MQVHIISRQNREILFSIYPSNRRPGMADKLDKFKTEISREFSKTIFYLHQHPELSASEVKQEIRALRLAIDKVYDNNK